MSSLHNHCIAAAFLLPGVCWSVSLIAWCCVKDCNGVSLHSAFLSQFSLGGALPCGVVQETVEGLRCVMPFVHSLFPSVVRYRVERCKRLQQVYVV